MGTAAHVGGQEGEDERRGCGRRTRTIENCAYSLVGFVTVYLVVVVAAVGMDGWMDGWVMRRRRWDGMGWAGVKRHHLLSVVGGAAGHVTSYKYG